MKSKIILRGMQIKSLDKARRLAEAINIIEEECGIEHVMISWQGFVCPWIDVHELDNTNMEMLLRDILLQYERKQEEKQKEKSKNEKKEESK